ncbi:hypothetical protein HBZS_109810 [Helicobacter bizzozeronii CCUG 35545]|nr:hypothetical protein HBZS_109810 [Helicobacter bizzozeronii CCUG 35545]
MELASVVECLWSVVLVLELARELGGQKTVFCRFVLKKSSSKRP